MVCILKTNVLVSDRHRLAFHHIFVCLDLAGISHAIQSKRYVNFFHQDFVFISRNMSFYAVDKFWLNLLCLVLERKAVPTDSIIQTWNLLNCYICRTCFVRSRGSNAVSVAMRFVSWRPYLYPRCWNIMFSCLSHFRNPGCQCVLSRVQ